MKSKEIILTVRKYQSFIISMVIFAILIWLVLSFLIPNIENIQATLEKRKNQDLTISSLTTKLGKLADVDKDTELGLLRKINTVLPEEKDVFSIFNGLDTLEKDSSVFITQSGFKIGVVSTGSAVLTNQANTKFGYQPIEISFEITGEKDKVISFLKNITSFKTRLFTAKDILVNYTDENHVVATFHLLTYYQPFPKQLGEAATPLPEVNAKQKQIREAILQNATIAEDANIDVVHGKANLFSP